MVGDEEIELVMLMEDDLRVDSVLKVSGAHTGGE